MANHLYDALFAPNETNDAPFLRLKNGDILSFSSFLKITAQFANLLGDSGLVAGDRLVVQVHKSPQALAIYAACVRAGIIFLPLNTAYTPAEVDYFVSDSGASMLLCDGSSVDVLSPVAARNKIEIRTLNGDGSGTFAQAAAGKSDRFVTIDRDGDDLAALLYTSGTTGRSKGAMLSHDNLLSNARTLTGCWQFSNRDVLLHALPIFHTHGLFVAVNVCLLSGASMVFLPGFNTDDVVKFIPASTVMMGVPTFYTRLLDDQRFSGELTKKMRLFISGSAPLLAETHSAFEQRTGHYILERYGMTETNMNTSNPYDGERRAGTVGPPLPGVDVRIVDAQTATAIPLGEVGIIEVHGPNVFKGYWHMPEKTTEEFRDDGFFITGDLGRIDADGYVHIVGRQKDLIISGGFNVYPKELELILDDVDGVAESAVIGVPHGDFGEAVVGIIVKTPDSRVDEADLLNAIDTSIARFKRPKKLVFVDQLPRNTMGKVQKNLLREQFADCLQ